MSNRIIRVDFVNKQVLPPVRLVTEMTGYDPFARQYQREREALSRIMREVDARPSDSGDGEPA